MNRKKSSLLVAIITVLFLFLRLAQAGQNQGHQDLEAFYQDYLKLKENPDVKRYLDLDTALRKFVKDQRAKPVEYDQKGNRVCFNLPAKYYELGLEIGNFSGGLEYSGKFLREAHKLNPHSPWRSATLYSTIMTSELGDECFNPNIKAAFDYEKEFPKGPFVNETLKIIAGLHCDLYFYLNDLQEMYKDRTTHEEGTFYHDFAGCYQPYVSDEPWPQQAKKAYDTAVAYFKKYLTLSP